MRPLHVEFFEDAIGIYKDAFGGELLYWTQQEWEEDPTVVFSIVNAVVMALNDPDELRRKIDEGWKACAAAREAEAHQPPEAV